jgi:hypothetical protein
MYVQSNRYTVLLYNRVYSLINAFYNVTDLTGPSSGAYQAVCAGLVNGDSRTVSCFWPLRCCRKNSSPTETQNSCLTEVVHESMRSTMFRTSRVHPQERTKLRVRVW